MIENTIKYIAFLRGINVGGKNKILMKDLKDALEEGGYKGIKTYIQSGNVILHSNGENDSIRISEIIKKAFGLDIKIIIRSAEEVRKVLENTPYKDEVHYVTFLSDEVEEKFIEDIKRVDGKGDTFKIDGKNIYISVKAGYHKTVYSNTFFEKKLKVSSTTRNTKVLRKIIEL